MYDEDLVSRTGQCGAAAGERRWLATRAAAVRYKARSARTGSRTSVAMFDADGGAAVC